MKRTFDFLASLIGLIVLSPFLLIIAIWVALDSRGDVFYVQQRVGRNDKDFGLFKFRTMLPDSDKKSLLTIGSKDGRITKAGYFLRKYKLDELPQLFNVLIGKMSFVGPRPEVRKYVEKYNEEQKKVFSVRPGITDYASIAFINENDLLGKSENPEKAYIEEIMPQKLKLNLEYIENRSFLKDIGIIFQTIFKIYKN